MATADPNVKVSYARIAGYDLKKEYGKPRVGLHRIRVFTKSIEQVTGVGIQLEKKTADDTVEFTITAQSRSEAKIAKEYIQGAFCKESAKKKYEEPDLPAKTIREVSGTQEAQRVVSNREQNEGKIPLLTEEALRKHDLKHMQGPCKLRQFGCGRCMQSWWRTVPVSKQVSRCRNCRVRYDALPRKKEFGIGRYHCTKPSCGRKFFAKCEATDVKVCRKCKTHVKNPYIHPRWRKASALRKSSLNPGARPFVPKRTATPPSPPPYYHNGPEFVPVSQLYTGHDQSVPPPDLLQGMEQLDLSRAPQRKSKRIFNASAVHNPSGSTISTFITQLDASELEVELDYDSDDEGVGPCRFECDCGNRYTVTCELEKDTAKCYGCGRRGNPPMGWARENLGPNLRSENKHSCSKCQGQPSSFHCPNLLLAPKRR